MHTEMWISFIILYIFIYIVQGISAQSESYEEIRDSREVPVSSSFMGITF